jgi:endoglucanase
VNERPTAARGVVVLVSIILLAGTSFAAPANWPLWSNYWAKFATSDGRIADPEEQGRTTSEAQAYGMFFALVANDREHFAQLLDWTELNLAEGDLSYHLPAWVWGARPDGSWGVLDRNSASDADLWIAYSLIQAGRLWREPSYGSLGRALAKRIATEEVVELPGFGTMLLPGNRGFRHGDCYELNPSYVPLEVLSGLAYDIPEGPWRKIADNVPNLVQASSRSGFAMDWVTYQPGKGFVPSAGPHEVPVGAWDAIRVYLWAGMLDKKVRERRVILDALAGMDTYLQRAKAPPMIVSQEGTVMDPNGGVGFSGALVPYLQARGSEDLAARQRSRVEAAFDPGTGLYEKKPRYFDQNLLLFSRDGLESVFASRRLERWK